MDYTSRVALVVREVEKDLPSVNGHLVYFRICELVTKMFRHVDLDGNAVLDKLEGKYFSDAFVHGMNIANAN
jgi:hypothetical protein